MATTLTADGAKQSLSEHVTAKGVEVLLKYGPRLGWAGLQRLLGDRTLVRYPCRVVFDAAPLQEGEFAFPAQSGAVPEDGFTLYVHPALAADLDQVPALVLYQLVVVNYGTFASAEDAECFGAAALGLTRDEYYAHLCAVADRLSSAVDAGNAAPGDGSACGCGCRSGA
jgi:hypothetical protein